MGRKYYLNAQKGEFSESRKLKERAVFSEITGHIVSIFFKSTPHGEVVRVIILDADNMYSVSLFVNSRVGGYFFRTLKNIDLHNPVTMKIAETGGKDYLTVIQDGRSVKWFFTDENKGSLPYDFTSQVQFFKEMVKSEIIPVLEKKKMPYPNNEFSEPVNGLAGGYFDDHASTGRTPGPVSSVEKEFYENGERW